MNLYNSDIYQIEVLSARLHHIQITFITAAVINLFGAILGVYHKLYLDCSVQIKHVEFITSLGGMLETTENLNSEKLKSAVSFKTKPTSTINCDLLPANDT